MHGGAVELLIIAQSSANTLCRLIELRAAACKRALAASGVFHLLGLSALRQLRELLNLGADVGEVGALLGLVLACQRRQAGTVSAGAEAPSPGPSGNARRRVQGGGRGTRAGPQFGLWH